MSNGLTNALNTIVNKLKDPFLLAILGLVIVLAIVAGARTSFYIFLVLSGVIVFLFLTYLIFQRREKGDFNDMVIQQLALRIVIAIQNEGYIPGNDRQADFGAALIAKVKGAKGPGCKRAAEILAREFKNGLNVPDSLIE